jgi:lysophospholipase L1-like esterase
MSADTVEYRGDAAVLKDAVRGARSAENHDGVLRIARLSEDDLLQAADDGLARVSRQLSGVRLAFRTRAEWIDLDVHVTRHAFAISAGAWRPAQLQATIAGRSIDVASIDTGTRIVVAADGHREVTPGSRTTVRLRLGETAAERDVQVWLPHGAGLDIHGARASHALEAAPLVANPRWVHHGSSISQCVGADTPHEVWPVIAAESLGWDVTSFGFGGQAMLDPLVARAVAETPADVVTLKLGINLVNAASMTHRTFTPALHGFLDIVRGGHPGAPIVLFSPIICPMHESVPGPTVTLPDLSRQAAGAPGNPGALTLGSVREAMARAVGVRNDPLLWYVDGRSLLDAEDAAHLTDGLHPDSAGYRLMAERFTALARVAAWHPSISH